MIIMSFSGYTINQVASTPMTLAAFLAITGFLASVVGMGFQMLDLVVIIQSPQMTMLDYFLVCVVIEELWDLWDFLRENESR